MDMHIFKVTVFIKQAINMNRIPDFMLRSVFSTCSSRGSSLGGGGGGGAMRLRQRNRDVTRHA